MTRIWAGVGVMVVAIAAVAAAAQPRAHAGRSQVRARPAAGRVTQARLSDANILAMMKGGDSVEVVLSKWVRERTTNAGLRSYTEMLTRDHSKGVREVTALARRVHIRPQSPADDTTWQHNQHVEDRLAALKGLAFDTAASRHWIRDHRHDIQDTERMMKEAHNAEVRRSLEAELPTLRQHLTAAEALTRALDREHGVVARRARR